MIKKFKILRNAILWVAAMAFAPLATAESLSGAFLAGRIASANSDYQQASLYYGRALEDAPFEARLLEPALVVELSLGKIDQAIKIATQLNKKDPANRLANMVLISHFIDAGNYSDALGIFPDELSDQTGLFEGVAKAWALLGMGKMSAAITQFDTANIDEQMQIFAQFHKSLALAAVGDFEAAAALLESQTLAPMIRTRDGLIAYAQVLSELGRQDEAIDLITTRQIRNPPSLELDAVLKSLENQTLSYDFVLTPRDGLVEVLNLLSSLLSGSQNAASQLIYAQLVSFLDDDDTANTLLIAGSFEDIGQYDLAVQTYDLVNQDDPLFLQAAFGRARALENAGEVEPAINALSELSKANPNLPEVYIQLGDMLRIHERFSEARDAYDAALKLIDDPQNAQWRLFYGLGVVNERLGNWPRAEAHFNRALEISPDQPFVLNYLGYSLVELKQDLDRAENLIELAAAGAPSNGAIADSLGWVRYRLGKYEKAVAPMERAIELLPNDPVVNDHLGDVYWKVARFREARFQWRRALSYDPEQKDLERIRKKLELGLDEVLASEGE